MLLKHWKEVSQLASVYKPSRLIYDKHKKSISHSTVVLPSAYLLSKVILVLYMAILLHIYETTLFHHFIMAVKHSCNIIHVILITMQVYTMC